MGFVLIGFFNMFSRDMLCDDMLCDDMLCDDMFCVCTCHPSRPNPMNKPQNKTKCFTSAVALFVCSILQQLPHQPLIKFVKNINILKSIK